MTACFTTARFPRAARVRARADFDRIFRDGRRVAEPLLSLHWLPEATPARLGLAVSRKVDTRAVGRNRIKRNLREQFRAQRSQIAPGSYVVVARSAAASAGGGDLRRALSGLLQRAGALPLPESTGTMRIPTPDPEAVPPRRPSTPAR